MLPCLQGYFHSDRLQRAVFCSCPVFQNPNCIVPNVDDAVGQKRKGSDGCTTHFLTVHPSDSRRSLQVDRCTLPPLNHDYPMRSNLNYKKLYSDI